MIWFHIVQAILPATAIVIVARRLHSLYRPGTLHGPTYCAALETIAAHAGRDACVEFARRMPQSAFTTLSLQSLASEPDRVPLLEDLRGRSFEGVAALRSLARMALPLAFLGGILQLSAAFGGGVGLIALQKGLAEHIALQSALLSFAAGLGTTLFCAAAAILLHRRAREQAAALDAVVRAVGNLP
jgi:hypothetical protein